MTHRIRVLVVDDSAFARKVLREVLSAEDDIEVVGIARDGLEALEAIETLQPDVISLDLTMPGLDGLGVLQQLESHDNPPRVVVVTTADEQAEIGVAALRAGAFDLVHKPVAIATSRLYQIAPELLVSVRAAALAPATRRRPVPPLRHLPDSTRTRADIVVIGASTGGPQAVAGLLQALPAEFPVPIAVVLHMPGGYTAPYADRLDRDVALEVFEASNAGRLTRGQVAIARAGMHLVVERAGDECITKLEIVPLETAHRPSVDVLFVSAAAAFGARVLGVVLTGMGDDGLEGARVIRAAGGRVIVEAESSCVVYGMPRAVSERGLANNQLPLDELPLAIVQEIIEFE